MRRQGPGSGEPSHTLARWLDDLVPTGWEVSGPAPFELKRADQARQEVFSLRRWIADVASRVAVTEGQVADTLERIAEHQSPLQAGRLWARADEAKRWAVVVRGLSMKYSTRKGDDDRANDAGPAVGP